MFWGKCSRYITGRILGTYLDIPHNRYSLFQQLKMPNSAGGGEGGGSSSQMAETQKPEVRKDQVPPTTLFTYSTDL